jgi:hypothetical protein
MGMPIIKQGPNRVQTGYEQAFLALAPCFYPAWNRCSPILFGTGYCQIVNSVKTFLMAKFDNGINGPFRGKAGKVIGSSWNGIPYMKGLPKRTKAFTDNELKNQSRFGNVQSWLRPVKPYIKAGYANYPAAYQGYAAAVSYLSKNALEGATVIPSKMKISLGTLPLSGSITYALLPGGQVEFSWDKTTPADGSRYDQAMLLAYDVEKGKQRGVIYGPLRSAGSGIVQLPTEPHSFHLYIAFLAADRSRQSDSVYLGVLAT